MTKDLWLPRGYELPDGSRLRLFLFSGEDWQIFDTDGADNILIARAELADKWCRTGFVDKSLFREITFGSDVFASLSSHKKYVLEPVDSGKSPGNTVDAMAFSVALKESRKLTEEPSFHDAIYVEQYSRLLPTWSLSSRVGDDVVLGSWLTGGVAISANSFRRLSNLAGWMSSSQLAEIVSAAGFSVPPGAGSVTGTGTMARERPDERPSSSRDPVRKEPGQPAGPATEPGAFTIPGRPKLEEFFNDHVIDIIFNPEKYRALGIEFPAAIVLHGPPGCGKTFAAERLVEFIDWPAFSIDSNSVGSPYIHETSRKVSEIFDKAIDAAPSVVVIDEMETFLVDRRHGGISGLHHVEEVAEFLRRIPEAVANGVLIVAMTNMIDMIDPAVLRRGRFDHVIEVGMPSREEVAALIESLLSKLPKAEDLNLEPVLDSLTEKPLSDAAFVVREAARVAAKAGKLRLDQESLASALAGLSQDREKKGSRIGFVRD